VTARAPAPGGANGRRGPGQGMDRYYWFARETATYWEEKENEDAMLRRKPGEPRTRGEPR
jgi:hypothetical protein